LLATPLRFLLPAPFLLGGDFLLTTSLGFCLKTLLLFSFGTLAQPFELFALAQSRLFPRQLLLLCFPLLLHFALQSLRFLTLLLLPSLLLNLLNTPLFPELLIPELRVLVDKKRFNDRRLNQLQ
jgi:hypothetical protein